MKPVGHQGLSLLLSAPIVTGLVAAELFVLAGIFVSIVFVFASVPDVDVRFNNKSSQRIKDSVWKVLARLSWSVMTRVSVWSERVPDSVRSKDFTIEHRGITHTVWFAVVFASSLCIGSIVGVGVLTGVENELYEPSLFIPFIVFVGGFLAVVFHIVGDMMTPTGVHLLTPRVDYGVSFDQFTFDNEVANQFAFLFGIVSIVWSVLLGLSYGSVSIVWIVAGSVGVYVIGIPVWLVVSRTVIGRVLYRVYQFVS